MKLKHKDCHMRLDRFVQGNYNFKLGTALDGLPNKKYKTERPFEI